jgi:hypothetical protein
VGDYDFQAFHWSLTNLSSVNQLVLLVTHRVTNLLQYALLYVCPHNSGFTQEISADVFEQIINGEAPIEQRYLAGTPGQHEEHTVNTSDDVLMRTQVPLTPHTHTHTRTHTHTHTHTHPHTPTHTHRQTYIHRFANYVYMPYSYVLDVPIRRISFTIY